MCIKNGMRAKIQTLPGVAGGVTAGGGGEGLLRCALHWQLSNVKHTTSATSFVVLGLEERCSSSQLPDALLPSVMVMFVHLRSVKDIYKQTAEEALGFPSLKMRNSAKTMSGVQKGILFWSWPSMRTTFTANEIHLQLFEPKQSVRMSNLRF